MYPSIDEGKQVKLNENPNTWKPHKVLTTAQVGH